jgi:hypothetical protein
LLCPDRALAHALNAECVVKEGRVEVEAFYDDGTPARRARVRIFAEGMRLVGEGKTDDKGSCTLARPEAGQYEVQVDAGAGHRRTMALVVPTAETAPAPPVSGTPMREERARYPWTRVLLGVLLIAAGGAVFVLVGAFRKARRRIEPDAPARDGPC